MLLRNIRASAPLSRPYSVTMFCNCSLMHLWESCENQPSQRRAPMWVNIGVLLQVFIERIQYLLEVQNTTPFKKGMNTYESYPWTGCKTC